RWWREPSYQRLLRRRGNEASTAVVNQTAIGSRATVGRRAVKQVQQPVGKLDRSMEPQVVIEAQGRELAVEQRACVHDTRRCIDPVVRQIGQARILQQIVLRFKAYGPQPDITLWLRTGPCPAGELIDRLELDSFLPQQPACGERPERGTSMQRVKLAKIEQRF